MPDLLAEQTARSLIDAERARQRSRWSAEHDAEHGPERLNRAARCYETGNPRAFPGWPFGSNSWNPMDPMRNLVRAGALYQAAADACPRRLAYIIQLQRAVDGRQRCEVAIDRMLAALTADEPAPPEALDG